MASDTTLLVKATDPLPRSVVHEQRCQLEVNRRCDGLTDIKMPTYARATATATTILYYVPKLYICGEHTLLTVKCYLFTLYLVVL